MHSAIRSGSDFPIFTKVGLVSHKDPVNVKSDSSSRIGSSRSSGMPLHTFIAVLLQLLQPVVDVLKRCLPQIVFNSAASLSSGTG